MVYFEKEANISYDPPLANIKIKKRHRDTKLFANG